MIDRGHRGLSVRRQCELLDLSRASVYRPPPATDPEDLTLMRRLDELYLKHPFYGSRRMAVALRAPGDGINRKRVRRLMRTMGVARQCGREPSDTQVDYRPLAAFNRNRWPFASESTVPGRFYGRCIPVSAGNRPAPTVPRRAGRFIPACAGNRIPDLILDLTIDGSSPRARGTVFD